MPTEAVHKNQNAVAENIVLAHALTGEPVSRLVPEYAAGGETVIRATQFSTAPYKDPTKYENKSGVEKRKETLETTRVFCLANEGTCKGSPMKSTGYCSGHSRSMGLIETWTSRPDKETE